MFSLTLNDLIFILVGVVLPIWFTARVARKAGFSRLWAILWIIPVLNVVMIWVFAFVSWPALNRNDPNVKSGLSTS